MAAPLQGWQHGQRTRWHLLQLQLWMLRRQERQGLVLSQLAEQAIGPGDSRGRGRRAGATPAAE
jgi:hypothetical protein